VRYVLENWVILKIEGETGNELEANGAAHVESRFFHHIKRVCVEDQGGFGGVWSASRRFPPWRWWYESIAPKTATCSDHVCAKHYGDAPYRVEDVLDAIPAFAKPMAGHAVWAAHHTTCRRKGDFRSPPTILALGLIAFGPQISKLFADGCEHHQPDPRIALETFTARMKPVTIRHVEITL